MFAAWLVFRVSIYSRAVVEAHYYSVPHRFVRADVK
jgi:hypothetical protein